MKKFLSVLLALSMVLSFSVCGIQAFAEEDNVISVIFYETDSTQVQVVEEYLKPALAEKFPDLTFEWTGIGQDATIIPTLSAAGDLPDIIYCGGSDMDPLLAAGDILDLAPYLGEDWVNTHFNNPAAMYDTEGHFYFMAPGQNAYYTPVFYYNTEIFAELGLEEPKGIEEFITVCQKLKDAGYIPVTTAGWLINEVLDAVLALSDSEAYLDLATGKCDWTDERIVKALGYLDQLIVMDAFTPDVAYKDDATAQSELQNKEAAMFFHFSWMNGGLADSALGFEVGEFSPADGGDDYVQLTWDPKAGCGCGYCVNSKAEDPELMTEIMKVFIDVESQRHNDNGLFTNYIVEKSATPANSLEAERLEEYAAASCWQSVLRQGSCDSATINEVTTLTSMLLADDDSYLSEQFIEDMGPVWEANTKLD